jgi:hypothetical protein
MTDDPILVLLRLRAEMVRLAHAVENLSDLSGISAVRTQAPVIAERMRNAAMAPDAVRASTRDSRRALEGK